MYQLGDFVRLGTYDISRTHSISGLSRDGNVVQMECGRMFRVGELLEGEPKISCIHCRHRLEDNEIRQAFKDSG